MKPRTAKLCIIGGGGVRTPIVMKTIAIKAAEIGIKQVSLFDIDTFKLDKYGGIAKEIAKRIDPKLDVVLETDPEHALVDCDYIITTIRVGGDASRIQDERIVSKHNLLAQETTGACGFAMAMRSIPTLVKYCGIAQKVANPNHLILNFTNPAGLVTQALTDKGFPVIGICDSPMELIRQLAELLEVEESRFTCNSFGLNHFSWFTQFQVDGKDVSTEILNHPDLFKKTEMRLFEQDILKIFNGLLLNEYLYFYHYNQKAIKNIAKSKQTRGELIENVNSKMNLELSTIDVEREFDDALKVYFDNYNVRESNYLKIESGVDRVKEYTTPSVSEFLSETDRGGYAGVALKLIDALTGDEPVEMVLSVPNNGALPSLESKDIVEITCQIADGRIVPVAQNMMPSEILNLIQIMKEYERLAVTSILESDKNLAVKALTLNPLVANHDLAKEIVNEFIQEYGSYGGNWK